MSNTSFEKFRFVPGKIPTELKADDASTPVDNFISALEYYKVVDEARSSSARIFPASCSIDLLNIFQSAQIIQCERLFAAENYSYLNLLSQKIHHLQRLDTSAMTAKARRLHAEHIADVQQDAATAHNCLVKNCAQLELECQEIGAAALVMTADFQHETNSWLKTAGKTLDKILQNTHPT